LLETTTREHKDKKDKDIHTWINHQVTSLSSFYYLIPGSLIRKLIMSIPHHMVAYRKARGWQTKY
jgi:hypothetical protein